MAMVAAPSALVARNWRRLNGVFLFDMVTLPLCS
jgi:hypothetical protein